MNLWFISDLLLDKQAPKSLFDEWRLSVRNTDGVVLLGNIASNNKAFWFNELKSMPGDKVLFCGPLETNRPKWYEKFGMKEVIPFGESKLWLSSYGKILLSHFPAYESVAPNAEGKFRRYIRVLHQHFDLNSCVLNIHGHTLGQGNERHNTFDVSYTKGPGQKILNEEQILQLKFNARK